MINSNRELANKYFSDAYKAQIEGKIEEAIELYKTSLEFFPTPEARTYLGWAYSMQGDYKKAIEECLTAIELDSEFGNPYNDIGAYLINLKKYDEAIDWLYKAIDAPRYESRHFPYFNLGAVFERTGKWAEAVKMYENAIEIAPDYKPAFEAKNRLVALMN